jgi:hypothetical protein
MDAHAEGARGFRDQPPERVAPAAIGAAGDILPVPGALLIDEEDVARLIEGLLAEPIPAALAVAVFWRQRPDKPWPWWAEWRALSNAAIAAIRLGPGEHAALYETAWAAAVALARLFPWQFSMKTWYRWQRIYAHRYHPGDLLGTGRPITAWRARQGMDAVVWDQE